MTVDQSTFDQFANTTRSEFTNRQIMVTGSGVPSPADPKLVALPIGTFYIDTNTYLRYEKNELGNWDIFSGSDGGDDSIVWKEIDNTDSPYSISDFPNLLVDTDAGLVQVVLPASPVEGDRVRLVPISPTYNTHNLIINNNGQKINGINDVVIVNEAGLSLELYYTGATVGWAMVRKGETVIINRIDASGVSGIVTETGTHDMNGTYDFTNGTVEGLKIPAVHVDTTPPLSPEDGTLWFDSTISETGNILYLYNNGVWVSDMNSTLIEWTPGVVSGGGSPIEFTPIEVTDGGSGHGVTISNNNQTLSSTGDGTNIIAGAPITDFEPTNGIKGVYFTVDFQDISLAPNDSSSYSYNGLCTGDYDLSGGAPVPPSFGVNFIFNQNKDGSGVITKELIAIQDAFNGSFAQTFNTPITFSNATEFCVAYDDSASANGTVYFYTSEQPNVPIESFPLPNPHGSLTDFLCYINQDNDDTIGMTILNDPSVEHTGVTNASGTGESFDPSSYPVGRAGKLYEIAGLTGSVDVEGVLVQNEDVVWFDLEGDFKGKTFGGGLSASSNEPITGIWDFQNGLDVSDVKIGQLYSGLTTDIYTETPYGIRGIGTNGSFSLLGELVSVASIPNGEGVSSLQGISDLVSGVDANNQYDVDKNGAGVIHVSSWQRADATGTIISGVRSVSTSDDSAHFSEVREQTADMVGGTPDNYIATKKYVDDTSASGWNVTVKNSGADEVINVVNGDKEYAQAINPATGTVIFSLPATPAEGDEILLYGAEGDFGIAISPTNGLEINNQQGDIVSTPFVFTGFVRIVYDGTKWIADYSYNNGASINGVKVGQTTTISGLGDVPSPLSYSTTINNIVPVEDAWLIINGDANPQLINYAMVDTTLLSDGDSLYKGAGIVDPAQGLTASWVSELHNDSGDIRLVTRLGTSNAGITTTESDDGTLTLTSNIQTADMVGGNPDSYIATKKYVDDNAGISDTDLANYVTAGDINLTSQGDDGLGGFLNRTLTIDSSGISGLVQGFGVNSSYSFSANSFTVDVGIGSADGNLSMTTDNLSAQVQGTVSLSSGTGSVQLSAGGDTLTLYNGGRVQATTQTADMVGGDSELYMATKKYVDSAPNNTMRAQISLVLNNANQVAPVGDVLPDNAIVTSCTVDVTTAYSGGSAPTMSVGNTNDVSGICAPADIDLTTVGISFNRAFFDVLTEGQVNATISGASTVGECRILIEYYVL